MSLKPAGPSAPSPPCATIYRVVNTRPERQSDRQLAAQDPHGDAAVGAPHAAAPRDTVPAGGMHGEPSEEWGWHGGFPRAARIGGWILAAIMFLMLIGNHEGNIENLWLIATGLIIIGILVADAVKRRTSWRR